MPKPKQETENDLCRCCHSEGAYKNLYASYSWVDVEEVVYSKLLQECFDIELAKVTQPLQNMLCTICDTCIERLQDAIKFKRQVQKCEKRFRDVYGSCVGEEATFEVKVKQEVDMDVKDDSLNGMHAHSSVMASSFQMMDDSEGCSGRDDDDDGFKPDGGVKVKVEMDDSDSEDDIVLKDISEAKKRRGEPSRAAKTTPATSSKKSKKDGDGEIEVIQGMLVIDKRTKRKKKAESAVAPKKRKKEDSESDDEELVTIDEDASKKLNKKVKRTKGKSASAKKKKKKRSTWPRNSGPAEDEEEMGTIDGISVIKVKIGVRAQRDIDYKKMEDKMFQCLKCPVNARTIRVIVAHIKSVHFKTARYRCPTCYDHFVTIAQLVKHKLDEHNIDQRLKCKACDKAFYEKTALENHKNSFHMLGKTMKCDLCKFETFNRYVLSQHKLRHSSERNYKCEYCTKAFKTRSAKLQHEKIHTGDKRKVCKECGKAYIDRTSLKYHMRRIHPGVDF